MLVGEKVFYLSMSSQPRFVVVKVFFRGKEFTGAKNAIDAAAQKYQKSMGYLSATMMVELLHHDKNERWERILA